ncbi:hypothetical protein [Lysinibacillus sp. RC79]|uniref:hypothetical protein n=1 Tax=Lysinibacillus sp. RC79 TaxID=3156296 RepID=UPI003518D228
MKHIHEQGYAAIMKNLKELKQYLDQEEYQLAKNRADDIEAILLANKDTKPRATKRKWDDERWN